VIKRFLASHSTATFLPATSTEATRSFIASAPSLSAFAAFTPLEQFDNVRWLATRTFERIEPYALFVLPAERSASQRYISTRLPASTVFTSRLSPRGGLTLVLVGIAIRVARNRIPASSNVAALLGSSAARRTFFGGFAPLALLATLHILTGGVATAWSADLFYAVTAVDSSIS
jgi:hypothetical protein